MRVRIGMVAVTVSTLLGGTGCFLVPDRVQSDPGSLLTPPNFDGLPTDPLSGSIIYTSANGTTMKDLQLLDVDGDGKQDILAVYQEPAGTRVVLLRATGPATFGEPMVHTIAGSSPWGATQLKGTAAAETVILGQDSSTGEATVDVVRVTSQGLEQGAALTLDAFAMEVMAVAAHDVNGDGLDDVLMITSNTSGNAVVHTLLRSADGSFQHHAEALPDRASFTHATFGDLAGNGRMDVVAMDLAEARTKVFTATADGSYQVGYSMEWGIYADAPTQVITGDFDHDGKTDVRSLHESCYDVFYRNQGDGTFAPAVVFLTRMDPTYQEAVGHNPDGTTQLMITGPTSAVDLLHLNAAGVVDKEELLRLPTDPNAYATDTIRVASGDLNGDQVPDYVFSDGAGHLFLNASAGAAHGAPLR